MFKCRKEWETPYGQADRRGFRGDGNFSTRPHAGDDVPDRVRVVGQVIFQPTSPRGGRPGQRRRERPGKAISTHVPTRGTTPPSGGRPRLGGDFNPRPHAGDDLFEQFRLATATFQPTSPRGGRLDHRAGGRAGIFISTHVPTRGTTSLSEWAGGIADISTHVPTRGTTMQPGRARSRMGISTHVPTRGTTHGQARAVVPERDFNPRPHAGDDVGVHGLSHTGNTISTHVPMRGTMRIPFLNSPWKMISTHVPMRGTTNTAALPMPRPADFNPRPHAGDD